MHVLIVESTAELALLWRKHLERQGAIVSCVQSADAAVALLGERNFEVIVLDLILSDGSSLAVADYAQYRRPEASVIFVTDTTFFSDGSIFSLMPNARALVRTAAQRPEDLAAMVEYYGRAVA